MKLILVGIALLACAFVLPSSTRAEVDAAGSWLGTLSVSGVELHIVVHLKRDPAGGYSATLDSPDQGALGIAVDVVTVKDGKLHLELHQIKGSYDGTFAADGNSIDGTWMQGQANLPLTLKRGEPPPPPARPQEPKPPYPYAADEVKYTNPVDGNTLAGTFTHPNGAGPWPAVLMITGSGLQDRNEEIFHHKPFLVIADYLTRRGIAVLRVDDRTIGGSTGDVVNATTATFATDVEAGVAWLRGHKGVDPGRVGLIGHSEGGVIAPMVAARNPGVAFIVMMAGTGVPGADVIKAQAAAVQRASGVPEAEIAKNSAIQSELIDAMVSTKTGADGAEKAKPILHRAYEAMSPEDRAKVGNEAAWSAAQLAQVSSAWFRYFLTYDPRPALRHVKCPVLALNGSLDKQVLPDQNLPEVSAALKAGGNRDFTTKLLPGLNHLFQPAKTGSPLEYAQIETTVDPSALKAMGDWIVAHTRK